MEVLVVIPARGGSKGIPGKNIKLLNDKPLIAYTIDAAKKVFDSEKICVSTDSLEIKKVVEDLGLKVPFLRPSHLSTDEAGSIEVLIHSIGYYIDNFYTPEVILLLQPTSPFRSAEQIMEAIALLDDNCDAVVSVKNTKSNPYSVLFKDDSEGLLKKCMSGNFTRRQDYPTVWELNGAIYCIKVSALLKYQSFAGMKIKKYIMDEISSIDIDTSIDWMIADLFAKKM
jgi:CMP-N,N'-diacetyllegionaminic acid synthase